MKRPLILHIGTTKTGSTSIQHVFSESRAHLAGQGVCYPRSPGDGQHTLLAYAMMSDTSRWGNQGTNWWGGMTPETRLDLFRREFTEEMAALPPSISRVILSSESIYVFLRTPEEVQRLHDFLAEFFNPIQVVVYLRRQDAHVTSFYAQILRTGEVLPPEKMKMRVRPMQELDYAALLGRWANVFGKDNVVPRIFEKTAAGRFDVVDDFAAVCGVDLPPIASASSRESNPSMNLAGQRLLVNLGEIIQAKRNVRNVTSPLWRTLTDAVTQASQGRGWQPVRASAQALYSDFKDSNEAVRSSWFPERATLFDEDFSIYPETAPVTDLEDMYRTACNTILQLAEQEVERECREAHEAVARAQQTGNPNRLRAALRRVVRVDAANADMRVMLAEMEIKAGQLVAARGLLDAARKIAPNHEGARALADKLAELEGNPAAAGAAAPAKRRNAGRAVGAGGKAELSLKKPA